LGLTVSLGNHLAEVIKMTRSYSTIDFPLWMAFRTGLMLLLVLAALAPSARSQTYEDATLFPADRESDDLFGSAVSISGTIALIGTPYDDDNGADSGSAYIFRYDSATDTWNEEAKLLPSDGAADENFGWSVCVSGDVALIGAPYDPYVTGPVPGSAYVFRYDSVSGTWNEEAKLEAAGLAPGDVLGYSVSVSENLATVGAPYNDYNGDQAGAAAVFRYDSISSAWNLEAVFVAPDGDEDHRFGMSVAHEDDRLMIGAPVADGLVPHAGAIYEYVYDHGSSLWLYQSKIICSDTIGMGVFGWSVSLSGDLLVGGAPGVPDPGGMRGKAYVFRRDGSGTWNEEAAFVNPDGNYQGNFGYSVSVDGAVALVGDRWEDDDFTGAAFKYRYNSSAGLWLEEEKLIESSGMIDIWFGSSVSLDNETALVGAPLYHVNGPPFNSGAAFAYGIPGEEPVIHVPADFSTIQAAIDAARHGYTVRVAPGVYNENIDFKQKAITVQATHGPEVTVIDGGGAGSVVYLGKLCQQNSRLDGFTVTNGSNSAGGGILCQKYASPMITNNIITGNDATEGGGIIFSESDAIVTGNLIADNFASAGGGGICSYDATDHAALISNNVIVDNRAGTTYGLGGGVYCLYGAPPMTNNIVVGNSATCGGGIYCYADRDILLVNNTVTENSATHEGGGIVCAGSGFVSCAITNSIVWNNSAVVDPDLCLWATGVEVTYCAVTGGWPGTGNISDDPLLLDVPNGDYHLTWNSPCRDAGTNGASGLADKDFEGDPRTALGTADMGADEFYYHLYHAGPVVPGSTIEIRVVGTPSYPVTLFLGSTVVDPPYSTQYGDYHLDWPPLWQGSIGTVPGDGVLVLPVTVPAGWVPYSEHPLQALVGPWGGGSTRLTNLMVLTVE